MTQGHDLKSIRLGASPRGTHWQHAANYDYTRHLTRCGWAWEFLRRNKDYALDWGAAQSEITMLTGQGGPQTLMLGAGASRLQPWGLIFRRCA